MKRRLAIAAGVLVALGFAARVTCPALLEPYTFSRRVYDRDGRLLRLSLAKGDTYRVFTPLEQMSRDLVDATLLYEDRWFYAHPGVNPWALLKGAVSTYVTGERRRGGSTLTMQLARLRYGIETRTVPGKALQILRAVQLELTYSKHDLLEAYLNLAPYGGNVEGAGAAARIYFHKDVLALSLPEAMSLAVMPQSPSARTPGARVEPESLRAARLKLAAAWLTERPATKREALALDEGLQLHTVRDLPFLAPHAVERALATREGDALTLTLDGSLQAQLERKVAAYVERKAPLGVHNAAALLADAETGEVLAHVGSADFHDAAIFGQVDGVTAPRSPGSALKPIVYARALDEGLIHPRTLLKDVPMRFGSYNPENFDSQYLGPMSATLALTRSRNVPAVELNLGLQRDLHAVLSEVGVRGLGAKDWYGAGIVLGAVEISMEELTALYVALARGGAWSKLKRVRAEADGPVKSLVSAEAAELTLSMLSAHDATLELWTTPRDTVRVAWKTGTSYAYRDAWTVGVAGRYVLAVWVGNFDGTPNPTFVGRVAAAPLFFDIVDGLRPRIVKPEGARRQVPVKLTEVEVCAASGKAPGPHCPHTVHTRVIPGVSPLGTCDVHRVFHVDVKSGERRCEKGPTTRDELFEVWPSDVAKLFARAGLPRKAPPVLAETCDGDELISERPPRILSPQGEVTYHLRRDKPEQAKVPLLAHADGAAKSLTWFAGPEVVGTVKPGEPLEWSAPSGKYELRAVDDRGGVARVNVTIAWAE
ncbi:MAG: penicillin-binding protein 1C [Myxococcaceae bacterium]|nr:penicillin-binding protein 1C [Myxococcaceae bacterium]